MIRKIISLLIIVELIFSQIGVVFANPGLSADFLYEMALQYYQAGNIEDALYEANVILLIEPTHKEAVGLIEQIKIKQQKTEGKILPIIIVETEKKPIKIKDTVTKKQTILATLDRLENEPKTYKEVLRVETAGSVMLEQGNKPIVIENIVLATEAGLTGEMKKPVVIAMEKILPKPKVTPQEWIIKPEEVSTSKELEGYHLFSDAELFINANPVEITPVIIKNGTIRIPLEKLAKALGLVVFSPERDTLTVINTEGSPLEFKVNKKEVLLNKQKFAALEGQILKYEGWTMLALEDLGLALGIETNRDGNKIMLASKAPQPGEFVTFTNAKPKEDKKPEEVKAVSEEPPPVLGRLIPVPAKLRPDIRLQVNNNISSSYDNLSKNFLQNEQLTITGDIYDYRLYSDFKWKQTVDGHFLNDGKYFGLFKQDLWLEFLNLSATIPSLRTQIESYEGAQITKFYNPFSTKVYIGQRDITVTGPIAIGAVRYYGHILGLEQKYSSDRLDITQGIISTEADAETELKAGTTNFPVKNIVSVTDATLKLPNRIDLSGQFAFCNFNADNNRDTLVQDNDWRLQAKMNGEKLYWDLRYEFVGDEYASLGDPTIYQDYKGWDLYSRYKLTQKLSFSGSYSQSQDNVDNLGTEPTNKNRNLSLGTNFSLPSNTNLGFNWLKGETRTEDPISGITDSTTYDYLFSLSRSWAEWMLMFTYDRYELDSQAGYFSDTGSVSFYKFMPNLRGSYLRARQQIMQTRHKDSSTADTNDYSSDFGFRYYFLRNLSMFGNLSVNNTRTDEEKKRDAISLSSGMQWDINQDVGFGLDFSFAPYDLSNKEGRNTRAWSALFRFFNRFEINSPAKWGKIRGRIFRDLNGNGKYDTAEQVFPAVTVRVPDEFIAQSNNNGLYLLDQIVPGVKTVIIETKDLPIELIPPEGGVLNVIVEPRKTINLDFPLVEASSILGRVFIDANNNGVYDPGEDGLEGMSVYLSPKARRVNTDENGYFFFEFLSPGKYEVALDVSQLPIEYKLASPEKVEIKSAGRQVISDANFRVIPKPIVTKKF